MERIKVRVKEVLCIAIFYTFLSTITFFISACLNNLLLIAISVAITGIEVYALSREVHLLMCDLNSIGLMMLTMQEIIKSRGDDGEWQKELHLK